jgi:transcriptional regulator with XRE-family HTH domain
LLLFPYSSIAKSSVYKLFYFKVHSYGTTLFLPFCKLTFTASKPSKIPQNPQTWGEHIKKRRLELKLLQREVATQLGVRTDTILNWEHNWTKPTLRHLPKIMAFLGYDPISNDPKTLGERLLKYRKLCGISQGELAKQIGIDPTTLGRIERNQGKCLPYIFNKVVIFLTS